MALSKIEKIEKAKRGEVPKQVPVSFWRHFYLHEESAQELVRATLSFQEIYDWDFIKITPRSTIWVEDWGAKVTPRVDEHTPPTLADVPIKEPVDWEQLKLLDPATGVLGEQIEVVRSMKEALREPVYFIETVFSPISIAGRIAGGVHNLRKFIEEYPDNLLRGLETITRTVCAFIGKVLEAGASGIFLTTTLYGTKNVLAFEEYERFARPFDLRVLEATGAAPFNVLHVCMSNSFLTSLLDYPAHALNWDATAPSNPGLREIHERTDKVLIGGISQVTTLLDQDSIPLEDEIRRAFNATGGRRFILGAGCSISTRTKDRRLQFVKEVASRLA